jgi:acyl-CoA synthetase (AMP-forming)/AMP-acid ligase II
MSHTTIWRNRDRHVDLTPGVLHEEVLGGAREWGERVAVLDAADGGAIAYGDLVAAAERFAAALVARGARRGDVLSLVASNGPDFPIAMHGALCAGLTLAPASALLTARELEAFLRQVRARFVVADAGALPTAQRAAGAAGVETVFALGSLPGDGPSGREPADPQAIALLMSSSGTTGLPKNAAHTHAGAVAMLRGFASFPLTRLAPDDVVGGVIPMAHIFGSVLLNSTLRAGARIVTLPRFELEAFLAMVQEHRVTVVAAVPPLARALARHPLVDRYDLSSLRLVLIGAAPCPTDIERECGARLGCAVGQSFGMTELAPIALPEEEWCPGALGRLVPGVEAVVVDRDSGARLGAGETGELWLRGPALMAGYLGDETATKATIDAQGWLHSGDLALFDADGHLFVVDRLKELIKCRGYQVAPAQLEAELALHPAVADAAVVGRPDEEAGERPVAYVALRAPVRQAEILEWLAGRVAPYKRPIEVVVVDEVPRNPTGKLLRRVLVERERERVAGRSPFSGERLSDCFVTPR